MFVECESMQRYHLRRSDKALDDRREIEQVLASVKIMTVACCSENEPYLFTVNFVWDPQARNLWFHCAAEGRKLNILRVNPRVCVSVIEDRGYIREECDHAYRSIIMEGKANLVTDLSEKRRALRLLLQKLEPQPDKVLARLADDDSVRKVGIARISVEAISGKQGPRQDKRELASA